MSNSIEAIRNLQRYLRHLAEHGADLPLVPIDGIYDSVTRDAVEAFQRQNHLPVTGIVDPISWSLLYAAYLESIAQNAPPQMIAPFPPYPSAYTIAQGEESELVWALHHILRTISLDYDGLDDIPDGMYYNAQTERAVRRVQRRHALPQTGQVDRATWNVLAAAYNRSAHHVK